MKKAHALILLAAATTFAMPASAGDEHRLATLPMGVYRCELPGDAGGRVGLPLPAADFEIVAASSYQADGAMGTYLLTGNQVVMTSGPRNGQRYTRQSAGFLRLQLTPGNPGELRCIRQTPNNR